ncbi:MAG TPA: NAD(P)H-hydrate dehydratase [Chitinophagaceae bacterium]|jgi:NAD(P)H-hydrate epimerase|nr:NAD(P)H-hydrate dehydratase [Chitinophagaceae bacterium]
MKILNAQQIREWDQYTIRHEPMSSIELMERAAAQCVGWLEENDFLKYPFTVFCGKGNNGGDGLAIARMLLQKQCMVSVHILEFGHLGTEDFQTNLKRLHQYKAVSIHFIQSEENFHELDKNEIIIDALFGSGLNRPLEGLTAKLVDNINRSGCKIISIDTPSGLPVDHSAKGNTIIKADHTLSFQIYKLAFLFSENAQYIGDVHILDIGLNRDFYYSVETNFEITDEKIISAIYKPRNSFAHKGNFGHALLITGGYGKMGAAVLCAKACLRTGAGLTTCHIPKCGYEIIQTAVPEAMVMTDFNSSIVTKIEEDISKFSCVGIGPGIGTASETKKLLHEIFEAYKKPVVLDADALNLISSDKDLLSKIPSDSILTPHPKEFERLFGKSDSDFDRLQLAQQKSKELNLVIVLKGHHTIIATSGGKVYLNNTGNAGMAKGGSGDVLTGILTSLICQNYNSIEAAILGVYLHGLAGDFAAEKYSMEAMTAGDIIENLGEGLVTIKSLG